jgi:hypothetical protein
MTDSESRNAFSLLSACLLSFFKIEISKLNLAAADLTLEEREQYAVTTNPAPWRLCPVLPIVFFLFFLLFFFLKEKTLHQPSQVF